MYHLHHQDQNSGPFSLEEIIATWNRGELDIHAYYYTEGMADWAPVADLIIATLKAEAHAALAKSDAEVARLNTELQGARKQIAALKTALSSREPINQTTQSA